MISGMPGVQHAGGPACDDHHNHECICMHIVCWEWWVCPVQGLRI